MGGTRFQTTKALAYQLWLEAGCPEGCAQDHWLEAERRIKLREATAGTRLTWHTNPSSPSPSLRGRSAQMTAMAPSPMAMPNAHPQAIA